MRVVEGAEGDRLPAGPADVLIALHAEKCAWAVEEALGRGRVPRIVVGLSGTDVYGARGEEGMGDRARAVLQRADRIVALQPLALETLPEELRARGRVILQSAQPVERGPRCDVGRTALVLAHLRPVKDPLLPARAAALLPSDSLLRVVHAGAALDPDLAGRARELDRNEPRWSWLGELAAEEVRERLATCTVLVVPSRAEGGANVLAEALVSGVPVLATRVPGNVGLLGEDHPGLFEAGDAEGLAALLVRLESEPAFLEALASASRALGQRHLPQRECEAWRGLLEEIAEDPGVQ